MNSTHKPAGAASNDSGNAYLLTVRRPLLVPWLVASLLAIAAVRVGVATWREASAADLLPQWDMAKYGVAGLRMADALRHLDPIDLLAEIDRSELWPPLFALLEAPAFVAFGDGTDTPRLLTLFAFAGSILAAWWAARQLDPEHGDLAGVLAALVLLASPMQQLFGVLVMLEAPGALLLLLALGSYARWLRTRRPSHVRVAWLAATALFFLKYNYGVSWLITLALCEAWSTLGSLAGARAWLGARLARIDWRDGWTWTLAGGLAVIVAVAILGARTTGTGGVDRRAIPLGWPVWALYALVLARAMSHPRRSWGRLVGWLARLTPAHRAFVTWVAAPIAAWMLVPRHVVGFLAFLENRSSGISLLSWDNLAFYPRVFVGSMAPVPWLGVGALVLAAARLAAPARRDVSGRPLRVALAVGLLSLVVHPYKEPRFLLTVAPLLWLAAAGSLTSALAYLWRGPTTRRVAIFLAVGAAAAVAAIPPTVDAPRLRRGLEEHSVPGAVREALDGVVQSMVAARGAVLIGYWNNLSPALVEWHARVRSAGPERATAPLQARRLVRPEDAETLPARAWERGAGCILVLDLARGGQAWGQGWIDETAWLDPARAALASDPRWTAEPARAFLDSGYSLRVYHRAPD